MIDGNIMVNNAPESLAGNFLLALPSMTDPRFEKAVIYICNHDAQGAMGFIINRAKSLVLMSELLQQIGIDGALNVADTPVLDGGPVDINKGFILHTADYYQAEESLRLSETLCLTATPNILKVLTMSNSPDLAVMAMGYTGWGPGQIEQELLGNCWMVVPARESLIFDAALDRKWAAALSIIGLTPDMISSTYGHA